MADDVDGSGAGSPRMSGRGATPTLGGQEPPSANAFPNSAKLRTGMADMNVARAAGA
jgi:hypothetical protein